MTQDTPDPLEHLKPIIDSLENIEERTAFAMGYDCGLHGPDFKNCNYLWFTSAERTSAWERGKAQAELERHHR